MDTERRLFQHGANLLLCFLFWILLHETGLLEFRYPFT